MKQLKLTVQELIDFVLGYKGESFDFNHSRSKPGRCGCLLVEFGLSINPHASIDAGFTSLNVIKNNDENDNSILYNLSAANLIEELIDVSQYGDKKGILSKEDTLKILKEFI